MHHRMVAFIKRKNPALLPDDLLDLPGLAAVMPSDIP